MQIIEDDEQRTQLRKALEQRRHRIEEPKARLLGFHRWQGREPARAGAPMQLRYNLGYRFDG